MATRLYLPSSGTPPLSSLAVNTNWELTNGLVRLPCFTSKQNTALATTQMTWPATVTQQWCWWQFQSDVLQAAYNWTTADTVSMVIGKCAETTTSGDTHLAYVVRVVSGDGSVIRGVIGLYHATSTEFPLMASAATRIHSARTNGATAFSSQAGDRIIIEIGLHGVTPAAELTQMRIGDPSTTGDFALTAGLTTDLCPWVELSRDVVFGAAQTYYQTLPVTEVAILSLTSILTWIKILSAIESSVANLSRIASYYRSLVIAEVSSIALSLAKTFYRTLSIAENSIANLIKGLSKTLFIIESSIISLVPAILKTVAMVATEISVATIGKIASYFRSLFATGASSPILTKIMAYFRGLSATVTSSSSLGLMKTFYRALSAIESAIAVSTKRLFKNLTISEVSVSAISLAKTFYRLLSVVESSAIVLTKKMFRGLSSVATSIASLATAKLKLVAMTIAEVSATAIGKTSTYFRALSTAGNPVPVLSKIIGYSRILSAVEISIASFGKIVSFFRNLITNAVSSVSLIANYIAGGEFVTHYIALIATTISIGSLAKKISKTLVVIEQSIVSLRKGLFKSLSVIESSIISLVKTFFRALLIMEVSIATIEKFKILYRELIVMATGVPVIWKKISKTLSVKLSSITSFLTRLIILWREKIYFISAICKFLNLGSKRKENSLSSGISTKMEDYSPINRLVNLKSEGLIKLESEI